MISRFKIFFLFLFFINATGNAQLPDGFYDELVLSNLDQFCGTTFDGEGRGFLWERNGRVFMLDTNGVLLPEPVIDISEEVANWWDMGMLGFVLDPGFLDNGKMYLFYVMDRHHLLFFGMPDYDPSVTVKDQATIGRITRFTADINNGFKTIVPGSRKVLVGATKETGFPLLFKTHGVGTLAFGTDGTLLATCGDTGHPDWADVGGSGDTYFVQASEDGIIREAENVGAFRSQLVNSLSGKLIRIDPNTGEGLSSNPFYDPASPNAPRSKVWALGLRNPYRFVVKPNSGSHFPGDGNPGKIFIGDVGSNYWEELNISTEGGQNFGWPIYEGFEMQTSYVSKNKPNRDLPNPLFGVVGCQEEYFLFSDLIAPPFLQTDDLFPNPCDSNIPIPAEINTFLHSRPMLAYRNKDDNILPEAWIPAYDDSGTPIQLSIDDPQSGVAGVPFIGISSLGGHFYQGDHFPEEYKDRYFHPDYHGWIRTIDFNEEHIPTNIEIFHSAASNIVSLTENPIDGCLYYIDFKNSKLRKICYGGTPAPVAIAEADRSYGPSPLEVHFDAAGSYSPANAPLTYHWIFGDGIESDEITPVHTFSVSGNSPRSFPVLLSVTDTAGQTRTTELLISLNNTPPKVEITSLPDSSFYDLNRTTLIQLNGMATDAEHGPAELIYEWRTFLHHDSHEHTDLIEQEKASSFFISPLGCNDEIYWYRVELNVTDAAGLKGNATVGLFPYCEDDFFELEYFRGVKHDRAVELEWQTIFEKDLVAFEVERGNSIFGFKTIGSVNTNNTGEYKFTDHEPNIGTNFYRLKIIEASNIFSYTSPIVMDFKLRGSDILVYPNPAKNEFTVSIKNSTAEKIDIKIYSLNGILLLKKSWPANLNTPFKGQVLISDLPLGVFYYELKFGEKKIIGSVMKN